MVTPQREKLRDCARHYVVRKNVLHQLFDVRPTTASGEIDVERIEGVTRFATVDLRGKRRIVPLDPALTAIPPEPLSQEASRQTIRAAGSFSRRRAALPPTLPYEESRLSEADHQSVFPDPNAPNDPFAKTELLQALAHVNEKDRVSWVELAHAPVQPAPATQERPRQLREARQSVAFKTTNATTTRKPRESKEEPRPAVITRDVAPVQKFEPSPVVSVATRALPVQEQERVLEGIFSPSIASSPKLLTLESRPVRSGERRRPRPKTILAVVGVLAVFLGGAGVFGGLKSRVHSFVQQGGDVFTGLEEALASFEKGDWEKALRAFGQAKKGFEVLSDKLENSGIASVAFAKGEEKINTGRSFLAIGKEASEIGILLTETAQRVTDADLFKGIMAAENALGGGAPGSSRNTELFKGIAAAENNLAEAARHLDALKNSVAGVEPAAVPPEYREKFFLLVDKLPELETRLREARTLLPLLKQALGENEPRKYLILLENSSELRAAGGFPGTYGLAEFQGGRLTKFFFDGIYNPDGQLTIRVAPPKALQRVSPFWGMRDAGWFFHFPTSAKKFAWFYEQAGGPRVDGVIAATPQFVERLLALTGSFSMPEYGQNVINERNFIEILQFEVEADFDPKLGNPKKILTDLAPKVLERMSGFHGEQWGSLLDAFQTSLQEKEIQLFSFNEELEGFVGTKGWGGEMTESAPGEDYLAVVHTNVAGGKADWVTDDELLQEISIAEDGTVMKTVSLTRRHKGGKTPYVWWNAQNKDYMRLLVPRGAALLAADGFSERESFSRTPSGKSIIKDPDIVAMEGGLKYEPRYRVDLFQERDKDAIAGWLMIPPGESRAATFRYRLPGRFDPQNRFVVHAQKQAGLKSYPVTTRILFPARWKVDHQPEGATLKPGFLEITQPFRQDLHYDIGFTRQ